MKAYADLEISFHYREANSFDVILRFNPPEVKGEEEILNVLSPSAPININREMLLPLIYEPSKYGQVLSESLFSNLEVKEYFTKIKIFIQREDLGLRLRLTPGSELHDLYWETLQDPEDGSPLATGERILFSRYLSSQDWRKICSRPRGDLKALVVIANPSDIEKYQLSSLYVAKELQYVKTALKSIAVTELVSGDDPVTLDNLIIQLREGLDILYLLCHGALVENEEKKKVPWLFLEDSAGKTARVSGFDIINQLKLMEQLPPRLVILASCESSGSSAGFCVDDNGSFVALGPLLAEAGVPAVLAMQGKIAVATASQFMPVLFEELNRHGQIDRAAAVARNAVCKQPDWWMPVLFMRLKRGRLWYIPGFFEEEREWEKWPTLLGSVQDGTCTPILGPGMNECILGCPSELARIWAQTYRFPLAAYQAEDLPQVIQYLAIHQDPPFPLRQLAMHYCQLIQKRYAKILPEDMKSSAFCQEMIKAIMDRRRIKPMGPEALPANNLSNLISKAGDQCRLENPADPHAVLAGLPLPLYLTTNMDNLMSDALEHAGKKPRVEICRWNDRLSKTSSIFDLDSSYWPDEKTPLVFHVFGNLQDPSSMVLSQDDYFDFLIGIAKYKELIPEIVRSSLADTALLFMGFQMEDWKFRVLFRSIISQWGIPDRGNPTHVAAQIDPDEDRILDPQGARRYLEHYFDKAEITIYWGRAEDFARDLKKHWDSQLRTAA